MKVVHFYLETGFTGCCYEDDVEFDDDATNEEIEEYYEEWADSNLVKDWWVKDE